MPHLVYVLDISCQDLHLEADLNKINILNNDYFEPGIGQYKLNPWIIKEANKLQISIAPIYEIEKYEKNKVLPELKIKIIKGIQGFDPGESGIIFNYEWDNEVRPLKDGSKTILFNQEFEGGGGTLGDWLWENAPVVELTQEDDDAIFAIITDVRNALANRDIDRFIELFEMKIFELGRALGVSPDKMNDGYKNYFSTMFQSVGYSVGPIQRENLIFRPQADGRIISIEDIDTPDSSIVLNHENRREPFKIQVSKIDGLWTIIR